ncbi:MAG: metallophosphoesterase [Phycisphaeraceae bacterium]|nr:metallophosphoesterase [Phycisphaeraceae bacterium]
MTHDLPADPIAAYDTRSAPAVVELLHDSAEANLGAACRVGSADVIEPAGTLIATGDLHDNPVHLARVAEMAGLGTGDPSHVTLHEVIHSDRLVNGMDLSHRALLRVAALKVGDPEHVHTILANHELAQIIGSGIVKDGVRVVEAFNAGVEYVFGDETDDVLAAIDAFIRSMPVALISGRGADRGLLCAHSLPGPDVWDRFDFGVLDRPLTDEDYVPRRGSAHLITWGRRQKPEQLEELAQRWGVGLFILGHDHAEQGYAIKPPNAIVLNSDHARGVAMRIDLADPPTPESAMDCVVPLAHG